MVAFLLQSIEDTDDRDFMENVYLSYKRLMFSEIHKITRDRWTTEDILHTVIEKLINKIQLLKTLSKPKLINYIATTSRNTAFNYLRSMKKVKEVPYDDLIEETIQFVPDIDEGILLDELLDSVETAWDKLDTRNKRILEMKYILENSDAEIAKEFGISSESVRMALTRARKMLRFYTVV